MTNTETATSLTDTHRAVLRYLVDAESVSEYTPRVEAGNRGLEGTAPYATLRAMERRGLVAMRKRVQAAVGAPAVSYWTAELTDAGRDALAAVAAVDNPGFGYGLQPTEHATPEAMVAHLADSGYAAGIEQGYGVVAYAIDGNGLHGVLEGTGWAACALVLAEFTVPGMYVVERAYQLPPLGEFRTVCPTCETSSGSGCATCRPDSVLGG